LGKIGDEILKEFVLFGAKLLDDIGEKIFDGFGFWFSTNNEGIVLNGGIG